MGLGLTPFDKPRKIWNIDNTENKAGSITHFTDLDVQTKGRRQVLRFLVTDIGNENVVLGYPWLATYEPTINWRQAVIHEKMMPIILHSINPTIPRPIPEYAAALTVHARHAIVQQLTDVCALRHTATELAIAAKQYTKPPSYPRNTLSLPAYLTRTHHIVSLLHVIGIMR